MLERIEVPNNFTHTMINHVEYLQCAYEVTDSEFGRKPISILVNKESYCSAKVGTLEPIAIIRYYQALDPKSIISNLVSYYKLANDPVGNIRDDLLLLNYLKDITLDHHSVYKCVSRQIKRYIVHEAAHMITGTKK